MVHYILQGKEMVPTDMETWAKWFESADRCVAFTQRGRVRVSTVALGMDHNFYDAGPPQLFETLVFNGPLDGEMQRYATWDEAEAGHVTMCARTFTRKNNFLMWLRSFV